MGKEEILQDTATQNGYVDFIALVSANEIDKDLREAFVRLAMDEFADQEKEKVALAFAEWKDNNVIKEEHGDYYFWDDDGYMFLKSITDLYQYFIENIYNK